MSTTTSAVRLGSRGTVVRKRPSRCSGRSFTSLRSAVARLLRWVQRSLVYFLKVLYIRSARLWLASHYQAETENAFGMWRIALTAPSSLKITETTSVSYTHLTL